MESRGIRRDIIIIMVVAMSMALPFIGQPYQLDDNEFMAFARQLQDEPLKFYLGCDDCVGQLSGKFITTHPPLLWLYLALMIRLSGSEAEAVMHGAYLVFPVIAGISMYFLGRRFGRFPLAAALLMVTSAGFVVNSHSVMGDAPAAALWLAAIAAYVYGIDRSSKRLLAVATLAIVLAVMTLHQSLCLVPLLGLYAILQGRLNRAAVLPLLVPLVASAAYFFFHFLTAGDLPRLQYNQSLWDGPLAQLVKARALLSFSGMTAVFPLALIPALLPLRRKNLWLPASLSVLVAAAVLPSLLAGSLSPGRSLTLVVIFLAGALIYLQASQGLLRLVRERRAGGREVGDTGFISCWILGVSFYSFALLPFISVRHLLLMYPAVILLFLLGVERLFSGNLQRASRFIAATLVAGGLLVTLPAAVADYQDAVTIRDIAVRMGESFADHEGGKWFIGEFGFGYYMSREGFRYLKDGDAAQPGDVIVVGNTFYWSAAVPSAAEPLYAIEARYRFPVRINNGFARVGFHNHKAGPLPMVISTAPVNYFTVYEIAPEG